MIVGDITESTDLFVIGGGPGGYVTALRAALRGLDVTLVEEADLGGVCLSRGCIPSKALAETAAELERAGRLFERGGPEIAPSFDMARFQAWKDGVVARLKKGVGELLSGRGVHIASGTGRFLPDGRAQVALSDGTQMNYLFRRAVIATGSAPGALETVPFDGGRILTPEDVLGLKERPASLVIVGADAWAAEEAFAFRRLGSSVTLLVPAPRLLPEIDADLVEIVMRRMRAQGIEVRLDATVLGVDVGPEAVEIAYRTPSDEGRASGARAVLSLGRRPRLDTLGLDALPEPPALDAEGFLAVNERQETSLERILAVGDVTGGAMLAHRATRQGIVAADVAAGLPAAYDNAALPRTVFTDPELSAVGEGEDALGAKGISPGVARFPLRALGRALLSGSADGFVKLVFDPDSRVVLGGGAVGGRATDLVAEIALAVETASVIEDVTGTIHAHPTYAEAVGEAALAAEGLPLHILKG